MNKTFVIGDIHGGLKALQQLLEKAVVRQTDCLIFLGDYVDGWSESAQVITLLIELVEKQECVFIKGNHDAWCEDWLRTGNANTNWLFHGGQATINSYALVEEETKKQHLHFFERMKMYHIDEQNRLFIHAGFTSMHGPVQEFHNSNYTWDRTLWEMAIAMDKSLQKESLVFPKRLKLFNEIYIGHTPTTNYGVSIPMQGCNVWNIDTGAAFEGKLSMIDVDSKMFWQSEALPTLYPNEKGRNKD
jgi:serine/threonine protein phosphatase 1